MDYVVLLIYVAMSYGRTLEKFNHFERMIDMMKEMILKVSKGRENPDEKTSDAQYHFIHHLEERVKNWYLLSDLHMIMLQNNTRTEFVTSDSPLIPYNLLTATRGFDWGGGMETLGLMYFLPISPKYCFMLYDASTYNLSSSHLCKATVFPLIFIGDETEINELNKLMFLNCYQNVYFTKQIQKNYVDNIIQQLDFKKMKAPDLLDGRGLGIIGINDKAGIKYKANINFIITNNKRISQILTTQQGHKRADDDNQIAKQVGIENILKSVGAQHVKKKGIKGR